MKPTERYAYSRNGDQGRVDEKCLVRVQVPTVDSSIDGKVRYHVRVTNVRSGLVWEVARRFSEFLKLRNELIEFFANTDKKCPGCRNYEKVLKLFEFPRKHVFTSVTPVVINYRKKALRSFVALLASHTFTTTPKCPTCCGFPFTGVRDWLTTDMVAGAGVASSVPGESPSNESIRDTMNVKDFTKYHPVTNSMSVDQEGRFVGSTSLKYASSVASTTTEREYKREIRSPPRSQAKQLTPKEDPLQPQGRNTYSDSGSSIDSVNDSLSPPSVIPTPGSARKENDIEGEDDEQEFESFVASSGASSTASGNRKHVDQPACEPLAIEDDSIGGQESAKTQHFKFARSSIGTDSERVGVKSRESSLIEIDGSDDDVDEEGLNMDFMSSVRVASNSAK
ncbi:hypothetical protein KXD40_002030 [Peronospora effusa]|uniref:PX domain-containing protein n=1 Tax=Peronospora effusa TaxID=542832 RepID=A0A3M6V7J8_9STRA|nr:hypothetical protein DD238_000840 [Peronospora effusa]RQM18310.1 hypothetical protein DD237_000063 [Peronospora effusa]UIZ26674.1 hypothetical protein KXD40_002030 [Peronospora effusa]CAI5725849.1 unnamed protein product [Peronospora effusa]